MSLPRPLNWLDMLDERIGELAPELFDMIKDEVFKTPPGERDVLDIARHRNVISKDLSFMAFDRKTRAQYAACYYGLGSTILITNMKHLGAWLASLPSDHIPLLEHVDCFRPPRVLHPWLRSWFSLPAFYQHQWEVHSYNLDESAIKDIARIYGGEELAKKVWMVRPGDPIDLLLKQEEFEAHQPVFQRNAPSYPSYRYGFVRGY